MRGAGGGCRKEVQPDLLRLDGLLGLAADGGLEVVRRALLDRLEVAAAAGARRAAPDGLDAPVVAAAGRARERARGAALPLLVERVAAAAGAHDVRAAVAGALGRRTLRHCGWVASKRPGGGWLRVAS